MISSPDDWLRTLCIGQVRLKVTPRGGTPIFKPYGYVPPQRVWFLRRFGLKTGIDFVQFGLESGLVFEGTTGMYERIYHFSRK